MGEWSVELDVREDAPSVFVPAERLPDAVVGDHVVVTSAQPSAIRRGRIVEILDDPQRGRFFSVSLDEGGRRLSAPGA